MFVLQVEGLDAFIEWGQDFLRVDTTVAAVSTMLWWVAFYWGPMVSFSLQFHRAPPEPNVWQGMSPDGTRWWHGTTGWRQGSGSG